MKALMYHYVRPHWPTYPRFAYLDVESFRKQLEHLGRTGGFVSQRAFLDALDGGPVPQGYVLTFDDGLADHYHHVLPELIRHGLWGLFYVPTDPYSNGRMLDVHRIHLLLGCTPPDELLATLNSWLTDDMLSHKHVAEFRSLTYSRQVAGDSTKMFKRILNYFVSYEHRGPLLDALTAKFLADKAPTVRDFYMRKEQLRALTGAGCVVGSHGVSHSLFSRLDESDQRREIAESFACIDELVGPQATRTFCYPYGGFHSFNDATERILSEAGCRFAFNVEPRDISASDLSGRPQALPRYDCNQFPYGQVSAADESES